MGSTPRLPSVLVVDDLADSAETLAALLGLHGFPVRAAASGGAALALADQELPDVVLLDLRMPGMDGFELARRLRVMAAGRPLVLVAVSGSTPEADRHKTAAAGIDHFVLKPAPLGVLLDILARGEPQPEPSGRP